MALRNERSKYVTNKRTKVPVAVGHGKLVVDGMGVGNYLGFVGQEVEPCRAGPSAAAASTRCAHAPTSKHARCRRPLAAGKKLSIERVGRDCLVDPRVSWRW